MGTYTYKSSAGDGVYVYILEVFQKFDMTLPVSQKTVHIQKGNRD